VSFDEKSTDSKGSIARALFEERNDPMMSFSSHTQGGSMTSDWVELLDIGVIRIADIEKIFGFVPERFRTCLVCGESSDILLFGTPDRAVGGPGFDGPYLEDDAEMVSQSLREQFHYSIELPVCDVHGNTWLPQ
jgi:hypothetical protein